MSLRRMRCMIRATASRWCWEHAWWTHIWNYSWFFHTIRLNLISSSHCITRYSCTTICTPIRAKHGRRSCCNQWKLERKKCWPWVSSFDRSLLLWVLQYVQHRTRQLWNIGGDNGGAGAHLSCTSVSESMWSLYEYGINFSNGFGGLSIVSPLR